MLDWIQNHSTTVQLGTSIAMTVIWVLYLQVIVRSFQRQRRTMVLINRGAGVGLEARCFVSNLGFEPIYLLDLLVTLRTSDGSECKTFITDRTELAVEDLKDPSDATNQGPLKSGEFRDIGSFRQVLDRANETLDRPIADKDVERLDLCVIATAASSRSFVAAHRAYGVSARDDDRRSLLPEKVNTTQLRGILGRRKVRAELRRRY